jgi:antagonist of KipI
MDPFALRVANMLVGNAENAAGLECTLIGPELLFSETTVVAVTGAEFEGVTPWRPFEVKAGECLVLGPAKSGARGYVAVHGGIDVERVLGSRSTFLRGGWGGFAGRELHDGDRLRTGFVATDANARALSPWRIDPRLLPAYSNTPTLRAIRGCHLKEAAGFFRATFKLTPQSDRMGFRFQASETIQPPMSDMLSTAVFPGTVQLPPDGQPVLLMADAQTIGGYPQIAHVITVDLPLAAQMQPGAEVRFSEISIQEAQALLRARERGLALLHEGLADKWGAS